jgi:hypothetical protein
MGLQHATADKRKTVKVVKTSQAPAFEHGTAGEDVPYWKGNDTGFSREDRGEDTRAA